MSWSAPYGKRLWIHPQYRILNLKSFLIKKKMGCYFRKILINFIIY